MSKWTQEPLGNIAEILPSNVDKKSIQGEQSVLLCNYMDVYANEYITGNVTFMEATATQAEIVRFRVKSGDVLLTKDSETPDDIGIPAVVLDDIDNLVCGYHLALLRVNKDRVDPIYLLKQLATTETSNYFARHANGSTRYGLSYGSITETPIPLAPLAQQQRIAEILSTIDETIEQTESLIAKMQQIKAGLMHDLFTRGITPDGKLRPPRDEAPQLYKESPLGWIPRDWDVERLSQRALVKGGKRLPSGHAFSATATRFRYLHTTDFIGKDIAYEQMAYISRLTFEALQRYEIKNEDIYISIAGVNLGWSGVFRSTIIDRTILTENAAKILLQTTELPDFVAAQINSLAVQKQISVETGIGAGVPKLALFRIERLWLSWPPISEQRMINLLLSQVEQRLKAENNCLSKLIRLKRGLMHDLLTGQVRVPTAEVTEPKQVEANV